MKYMKCVIAQLYYSEITGVNEVDSEIMRIQCQPPSIMHAVSLSHLCFPDYIIINICSI